MGDMSSVRSRKWQITINNPEYHGFTDYEIKQKLSSVKGLPYWCMCREIGDECETLHVHLYLHFNHARSADRINNLFPNCHRLVPNGTAQENRAYILKDGEKFNKDENGHYHYVDKSGETHDGTNFSDTFYEEGECPEEHQGKAKSSELIVEMIKDGASDEDIVNAVNSAYRTLDKIRDTRSMYRESQFRSSWRDLEVTYIFGKTGLGKTRMVMEKHGYSVYRVTDYRHYPFDDYDGEDVLLLEEFRSDFKIGDCLKYLDGYPLRLTARFRNKVACYTKVYIVSNWPPESQYNREESDSRDAFWRRVHHIIEFMPDGSTIEYNSYSDYRNRYAWVKDAQRAELEKSYEIKKPR